LLVKNDLLEAGHEEATLYKTTQKGIELLECFKAIQKMIPELGNWGGWQILQGAL